MIRCRSCGTRVRFRHIFRWLNAGTPSLACANCEREIAGPWVWVSILVITGLLFFIPVHFSANIAAIIQDYGFTVPVWLLIGTFAFLMPVYMHILAILWALVRA